MTGIRDSLAVYFLHKKPMYKYLFCAVPELPYRHDLSSYCCHSELFGSVFEGLSFYVLLNGLLATSRLDPLELVFPWTIRDDFMNLVCSFSNLVSSTG